jgi:UDP:flavonoid glycosyltransferase YjiC (YdhE family)
MKIIVTAAPLIGHLNPLLAAGRIHLVVVATTGGRPVEALGPLPENARVAEYLPYDWLMPKVDLLVTNGGYGTVTQALSLGIPLVQAGTTEDKREVAVRIANSGAGVALGTDEPTPPQIRVAARRVLDIPSYGNKAEALAREFQMHDLRRQIGPLLEGLIPPAQDVRHLKIAS